MTKEKNPLYINALTPFAELKHLYLAKQDTKFDPKYAVDIRFDTKDKDAKKFLKELVAMNKAAGDELMEQLPTKGKKDYRIKDIVKEEEDDQGNATGFVILKATTKEKPIVKDCDGNTLEDSFVNTLGNGTVGRVKLCLSKSTVTSRKTVGLAVYMSTFGGSVQIKTPVFYTGGDDGFGKAEGFVAPKPENASDEPDF